MSEVKKSMPRPLPKIDAYMETRPFWDAAREGKLLLQFCKDTGQAQFFPRPVSMATGKRNLEWRQVSGRGKVYSWTVTNSPWPGHEDRVPFICALIELEEGARILANIFNCKTDEVTIDMPVKLCWEKLSEEINYPAFEPAR